MPGTSIIYSKYTDSDFESLLNMGLKLWDDFKEQELADTLKKAVSSSHQQVFMAKAVELPIAFGYVSIRTDYVEGAEQSPTGYLEGIFVESKHRKKGIAKHLVTIGEEWLKNNGCNQIGSDTWLWNKKSQEFHKKIGFWEEERLVHFLKDI
ncbi:MAG: aminoglycoside 6'-N-acetyltransferase [Crocinitomicaceae bacterium]